MTPSANAAARIGFAQARNQDGELVAAHAGYRIRRTHASLQPPGHVDEHSVSASVSQAVVDVLESIEIDQHYAGRAFMLKSLFDAGSQERPVG